MVRRLLLALTALLWAAPALAEGNLTLTIRAETPGKPVVGEMIRVTIRAVYDRKVANEALEIDPSDAFDWIQLAHDDWREERIDGLPWIVMERRLAIWPRRAGLLRFGPARHRLTIIDQQSRRQDVVVEARPLDLSIGEFPEVKGWRFTASLLELTDEISTDAARLADGEIATRTVTLRALGALPEHLPPRPIVSEPWLITFTPPVERDLELTPAGPVAKVVWTWRFRPETGEPGVLESVKIPWFDTRAHKMETVEIPALAIGYASFYAGRAPTGRVSAGQVWALGGLTLLGCVGGLGLAARRLAPERTAEAWRRARRRWSPLVWWTLWRARRRGDLLTQRRLAEDLGFSAEAKAALDRAIYGP